MLSLAFIHVCVCVCMCTCVCGVQVCVKIESVSDVCVKMQVSHHCFQKLWYAANTYVESLAEAAHVAGV